MSNKFNSNAHVKTDNFASANRAHYNDGAQDYSKILGSAQVRLYKDLSTVLLRNYAFNATSTEVMEFACGTGLVAREIAPHCKTLLGVDISEGMIKKFDELIEDEGLKNTRTVVTELKGADGELNNARFDVIICCSAYHHFASIEEVTRTLTHFLKPSGVLLVTDLLEFSFKSSKAIEHYGHIAPHVHGLRKEMVAQAFERNGLIDVSVEFAMVAPKEMFGLAAEEVVGDPHLFIAKGSK